MRTIDADELTDKSEILYQHTPSGKIIPWSAVRVCVINNIKTIEAEPVRHWGISSIIETDDINTYNSRIILVDGKKSKSCRVFYEDDREHGEWIVDDLGRTHCSICRKRLPTVRQYYIDCDDLEEETEIDETEFCPNCGAIMDGGSK